MPRGVKAAPAADQSTEPKVETTEAEQVKAAPAADHRFEEFDATRPDGVVVHIRRNIDTGEQTVTEK